jgi:phage-related protein
MEKKRTLFYYKGYYEDFYKSQTRQVKSKIDWTIDIIEVLHIIPGQYFKHIAGTDLYEIRIQTGGNAFRIFCFFDKNRIIVVGHGFQKKTEKTPQKEIDRAIKIKKDYENEKLDLTRRTS